jgi:RHS repeat-associated protein
LQSLVNDYNCEVFETRALTSIINRYYDPTTDQFLSVDPDVAQTDQPYVFTNDDPLNLEDPLGMEALKSVVLQEDAAAKRCKDNPKASGCQGLDIGKDLLKAAIITVVVVGGAACVAATAGVCGAAAFTVGGFELSGGAIAVGVATGAAEGAANYTLDPGTHTVTGFLKNAAVGAGIDAIFVGAPEEAVFGNLGSGAHAAELSWLDALKYLPKYLRSAFR